MESNIIVATFVSGITTVRTARQWQWDRGMFLSIEGVELPALYEVHFSNSPTKASAIRIIGSEGGVAIPDALFTAGTDIYAWVYVIDDAGTAHTELTIIIPVGKRPMPSGMTYLLRPAVEFAEYREEVETLQDAVKERVTSLGDIPLVTGHVVNAVGIPVYVSDVSEYVDYGITETGWYVFARIAAKSGAKVTDDTTVTGAAGSIITAGDEYVDVAVRFEVAAQSQRVVIAWSATDSESFVFTANDLAVRNLDYRTTFYVYDLADFVKWTWARVTTGTFASGKNYFLKSGDEYTAAEVTVGNTVPVYYVESDGAYVITEDTVFAEGTTYYTLSGTAYVAAGVTVGDTIPEYYTHSEVLFEGMTPNVTYKLDTMIDCPIKIALPDVEEDGHGAWYEFQLRYDGSYSCTLLPESSDVKAGTATTQNQTAGINVIDLHYTSVNGAKIWTLMNTHSNIPA